MVQSNDVNVALDELTSCVVKEFSFDMLQSKLTMRVFCGSIPTVDHIVTFEETVSVFFAAGAGSNRLNLGVPVEYCDWRTGGHYPNGCARLRPASVSEPWAERFSTLPNFAIELGGGGALLIEARKVTIDDRIFDVGYADPDWQPDS